MDINIFVKPGELHLMTYRRRWNENIKIEDEMRCHLYGVSLNDIFVEKINFEPNKRR